MDVPAEILRKFNEITVVGCSGTPGKDAHDVPAFMLDEGFEIVPVNPNRDAVLGRRAYPTLADVPNPRFVNVFRPSEQCEDVARAAADAGAEALWLQLGIRNDAARRIAEEAGMLYVEDHCLRVEWPRVKRSLHKR